MRNTMTFIVWILIVALFIAAEVWGMRRFGGLNGALRGWGTAVLGVVVVAVFVHMLKRWF
jgi:hypothetical protein